MKTKVIRYTFTRNGKPVVYKHKKPVRFGSSIAELLRAVALAGGKI